MDTERTLAATSFVRVFSFAHGPGEHRDPKYERFDHPELIFTVADRWALRCARGEAVGRPGTLVLGNQGEEYRCRHFAPVPRDRMIGVSFVGLSDYQHASIAEWLEPLGRPLFPVVAMPLTGDLRWYLRRLLREATHREPGFQLKVDGICSSMLIDIIRAQRLRHRPRVADPRRRRRAADGVARARAHIERHFASHVDLFTLARVAGMSPFHFTRVFKQLSGCSPYRYVVRTRLDRAATLLRNTSASVLDVALTVGFEDATHFARSFRRQTGVTPSAYRLGG